MSKPRITRNPDGTITVTRPDGSTVTPRPASPSAIQRNTEAIEAYHRHFKAMDAAAPTHHEEDQP